VPLPLCAWFIVVKVFFFVIHYFGIASLPLSAGVTEGTRRVTGVVRPAWSIASWCKTSHEPERRQHVDEGKGARRNSHVLPDEGEKKR
jgi:hypothetical protein